jgi:hypothetical protein
MSRLQIGMCPNMTATVFERLRSAGIRHVVDFFKQDVDELAAATGVAYRDLVAIRRTLLAAHTAPIVGGLSAFDSVVDSTSIISTGCPALDGLLDGGLITGEVFELLAVNGPSQHGRCRTAVDVVLRIAAEVATVARKTVVWFDAGGRFDAARLAELVRSLSSRDVAAAAAASFSQPPDAALRNVHVSRVFDLFEMTAELSSLSEGLASRLDAFFASTKLVVVDGVIESLLPPLTGGAIPPDDCRGYVSQLVAQLRQMACEFSIAVVLVGSSSGVARSSGREPRHGRSREAADVASRVWSDAAATRVEICGRGPFDSSAAGHDVWTFAVTRSGRLKTGQHCAVNLREFLLPSV